MSTEPDPPGTPNTSWSAPEQTTSSAAPNPWGGAAPPALGQTPPAGAGWDAMGANRLPAYGSIVTRRGIVAIKPLGLGDILDGSFRAIRHNPRVMIGMSLLVILVTTLVSVVPIAFTFASGFPQLADTLESLDPEATPGETMTAIADPLTAILGGSVIGSLLAGAGVLVLNGILIVCVGQSVVDRKITFGETWRRVRGRVLPLLGQTVVIGLAVSAPYVVALGAGTLIAVALDPVAGVILALVLLAVATVLSIYLAIVWALAPAVLVLERGTVLGSLGRSRGLLRNAFWRTLGILLLTSIIVGVLINIISFPLSLLAQLPVLVAGEDAGDTLVLVSFVLAYIATQLVTVLVYPFLAAVVALLYIDRRIRTEGLDIALTRALAEPT